MGWITVYESVIGNDKLTGGYYWTLQFPEALENIS